MKVVAGLLRGETVDWSEEGGTHKIRFLNPELGLINIKDPIPTFLSAFGPKARRLTAKLGAGWFGGASFQSEKKQISTKSVLRGKNLVTIPRNFTPSPAWVAVFWMKVNLRIALAPRRKRDLMRQSRSTI